MSDDLPGMRASHADRDRVVDALRVAGGDGRLSAEEVDTRLESALSARTLGELAELTADLPIAPAATGKDVLVVEQHGGRYVREGRWPVPARIELAGSFCTRKSSSGAREHRIQVADPEVEHGLRGTGSPSGKPARQESAGRGRLAKVVYVATSPGRMRPSSMARASSASLV